MSARLLNYRGLDRRGVARTGRVQGMTPAELAANLYTNRWREAAITDDSGTQVGGVRRNDAGQLVWWGHQ